MPSSAHRLPAAAAYGTLNDFEWMKEILQLDWRRCEGGSNPEMVLMSLQIGLPTKVFLKDLLFSP
jgi:hypothetical protein